MTNLISKKLKNSLLAKKKSFVGSTPVHCLTKEEGKNNLEVVSGPISGVTERLCGIIGGTFKTVGHGKLHASLVDVVVTHCKEKTNKY